MVNDRELLIKASLAGAMGRKFRRAIVLLDMVIHELLCMFYGSQPAMPVGVLGEPNLIVSNKWLTW